MPFVDGILCGVERSNSFIAFKSLVKGEPQAYAAEMDNYFAQLNDPTISEVTLLPLENSCYLLTGSNQDNMVNHIPASYYHKTSVTVIEKDE